MKALAKAQRIQASHGEPGEANPPGNQWLYERRREVEAAAKMVRESGCCATEPSSRRQSQ